MKFNDVNQIILFGGSPLILEVAKYLKSIDMIYMVYTSPRQANEIIDQYKNSLRIKLLENKINFIETEDINKERRLLKSITTNTLGLGLGEAWPFSRKIIELFSGRLMDFMGIPHPKYRGGAHYSWMILNNNFEGGCNIQIVNEFMIQGKFDNGEIIKSKKYKFPKNTRIPIDFFNAAIPIEIKFIKEFINEIKRNKFFSLKKIKENESLFFPRQNTLINGWINWGWDGIQIEKFIRAFDEPYKGASTLISGKRVHLKTCSLKRTIRYHPYLSGLVLRISQHEGYVIATSSGNLLVKNITDSSGVKINISVGDRLFTPLKKLEESLTSRIFYGSK